MDEQLKKDWVAALRSGEFKQCGCALVSLDDKAERHHCCLGVLSSLIPVSIQQELGWNWTDQGWVDATTDSANGLIPRPIVERIGLRDQDTLSSKNDAGASFAELADYIEEYA